MYLYDSEAPERACQTVPDARLIVLLRNPVDRAFSQFQMEKRHRGSTDGSFPSFESKIETELDYLSHHPFRVESYEEVIDGLGSLKYVRRGIYLPFIRHWLSWFKRGKMLVLRSEDFFETPVSILQQAFEFLGVSAKKSNLASIRVQKRNVGDYRSEMSSDTRQKLESFYEPFNNQLARFLQRDRLW